MTLFGWIVVGVGLLVAGWLFTRLNKTSGSSSTVALHNGVGYLGLDPEPNNIEEAVKAHGGVGYTGVSAESAPDTKTVDKKVAKKAPAKKTVAKKTAKKPTK